MRLKECRANIVDAGNKLVSAGLTSDGQGNLSCRDRKSGLIAITPSAVPYHERMPEDICIVDSNGALLEGKWQPTTEMALHLAVLNSRPSVQAVIHTHAPYSTIFSLGGEEHLPMVLNESAMVLGRPVPVASYARPGSDALAQLAADILGEGRAVILAHHGLVSVGETLEEAYLATMAAEHTARAVCIGRSMGGKVHELPDEEVDHLRSLYEGYSAHRRDPAEPPAEEEKNGG